MKHIFLVTDKDGKKTAHTAVQSFLEHPNCVGVSKQYWSELVKKNNGYPITYKGFFVERIELFRTSESRILDFESRVL